MVNLDILRALQGSKHELSGEIMVKYPFKMDILLLNDENIEDRVAETVTFDDIDLLNGKIDLDSIEIKDIITKKE